MRERFRKFMQGRNGVDRLTNFLIIISLLLMIVSRFIRLALLRLLALGLIIFAYFRVFSKNLPHRREENAHYLRVTGSIRSKIRSKINMIKGLKKYKYFKCPNCNQRVRVPRKKGKIKITCPKCKNEMTRRT